MMNERRTLIRLAIEAATWCSPTWLGRIEDGEYKL